MTKLVGYGILLYLVAELFSPDAANSSVPTWVFLSGICLGFVLVNVGVLEETFRRIRSPAPRN